MSAESSNDQAGVTSRCNVYAGSDIGYLKGVRFATKSFANLNTVEKLDKKMGISCLCWGNVEESTVYAGCKGGDVIHHCAKSGFNKFVFLDHDQHDDKDDLQEICVIDDRLLTAFRGGSLYVHKIDSNLEESLVTTERVEKVEVLKDNVLAVNKNFQCMDHNKSNNYSHLIATGGNENPLKVWDINCFSASPVFIAKNVKNDWLNLPVPMWVTKAKFYPDSNKVVTGTGYGKVRMYDPSTPKRRPVIDITCEELEKYPITALDVRPNSDYQVFVGNTVGTLISIDLRKKSIVKAFKGNKGGVTDLKFHSKYPVFAVCSADRYVRCYDPDMKSSVLHSFYVNSSLNCILFSTDWEKEDYGYLVGGKFSRDKIEKVNNSVKASHDLSDGEEDDVWNKMEVVRSKKRKVQ